MSPSDPSNPSRGKPLALIFCFGMIGAVLWPIQQNWRRPPTDNFPLSYYPMFSDRRKPVETFYYVVGLDSEGKRYFIKNTIIGDGGENSVRRQVRKIINAGRAPELAQTVAARLAKKNGRRWGSIVSVAVCKGKYSVDDWFHGRKHPVSEQVVGSAEVSRTEIVDGSAAMDRTQSP